MLEKDKEAQQQDANDQSLAGTSVHAMQETYYRIVCPEVWSPDWRWRDKQNITASDRLGPDTFWTPRPDSILHMLQSCYHCFDLVVNEAQQESEGWKGAIYSLSDGLVKISPNTDIRSYDHAGERVLVEAYCDPKLLIEFDIRCLQDPQKRLQLKSELLESFDQTVTEYVDYSRGEAISYQGKPAFVFPRRDKLEVARALDEWRFEVLECFDQYEAFRDFLLSSEVKVPADFDSSCQIGYFWMDLESKYSE